MCGMLFIGVEFFELFCDGGEKRHFDLNSLLWRNDSHIRDYVKWRNNCRALCYRTITIIFNMGWYIPVYENRQLHVLINLCYLFNNCLMWALFMFYVVFVILIVLMDFAQKYTDTCIYHLVSAIKYYLIKTEHVLCICGVKMFKDIFTTFQNNQCFLKQFYTFSLEIMFNVSVLFLLYMNEFCIRTKQFI